LSKGSLSSKRTFSSPRVWHFLCLLVDRYQLWQ